MTILLLQFCRQTVLVLCFLLLGSFAIQLVDATIRIVTTGEEFPSRPDKYVGMQLEDANNITKLQTYLQHIRQDPYLCGRGKQKQFNITVPTTTNNIVSDEKNAGVALLVKKGRCSFAQKLEFAARNIYPLGLVKVLIVDGELRIGNGQDEPNNKSRNDHDDDEYHNDDDDFTNALTNDYISTRTQFRSLTNQLHNDVDSNSDTRSSNRPSLNKRRKKNHHQNDDDSIVLLHVSYQTGLQLLKIVYAEAASVRNKGGTLLEVDADIPPISGAFIILWTSLCLVLALSVCCCMAGFIEELWENQREQFENEPPPIRRRRRQRLTLPQAEKIPIGIFDGEKLVYESDNEQQQQEDKTFQDNPNSQIDAAETIITTTSCAICLDNFEIGDKLRRLPCQHVFKADCIAKWLVERSATCPLCNTDLYYLEGEDDDDSNDDNDTVEEHEESPPRQSTTTSRESSSFWWTRYLVREMNNNTEGDELLSEPLLPHIDEGNAALPQRVRQQNLSATDTERSNLPFETTIRSNAHETEERQGQEEEEEHSSPRAASWWRRYLRRETQDNRHIQPRVRRMSEPSQQEDQVVVSETDLPTRDDEILAESSSWR